MSTTEAARVTSRRGDAQPQPRPSVMPRTRAPTPSEAHGTPSTSTRRRAPSARDSTSTRIPNGTASAATGTLIRNTARQPKASISRAPSDGATAPARPPVAAQIPMAIWRRDTGNAANTRASPAGKSMAPPIDWATRAPISQVTLRAAPEAREPRANTVMPMRNSRLRPNRSAAQPDANNSDATPML